MPSPELETLDQLLGGDMPVSVIAKVYPSLEACRAGLLGLLHEGDVTLLNPEHQEIPHWQSRELFSAPDWLNRLGSYCLHVTTQGANRIA
jgi:hypothetical protein